MKRQKQFWGGIRSTARSSRYSAMRGTGRKIGNMADAKGYHNQFMTIAGVKKLQVLCAMLVLLHHLGEQGVKYLKIFTTLGFYPVAFFFFCSGYGLVKSWLSKPNYIENFWKKRMVKILCPYVIANVLYLIVKLALNDMDGLTSFKSFVSGGGVVKYSWYVIAIIYFYIAFYLCFRIFGKRSLKIALSGIAATAAVWMIVMIFMQFGEHRYVPSPCFILGCYIGQAGCPKHENICSGGAERKYRNYCIEQEQKSCFVSLHLCL